MAEKQKKSGNARKIGRARKWCEAYRKEGKRESNKKRKIIRHLKKYPNDQNSINRLKALGGQLPKDHPAAA